MQIWNHLCNCPAPIPGCAFCKGNWRLGNVPDLTFASALSGCVLWSYILSWTAISLGKKHLLTFLVLSLPFLCKLEKGSSEMWSNWPRLRWSQYCECLLKVQLSYFQVSFLDSFNIVFSAGNWENIEFIFFHKMSPQLCLRHTIYFVYVYQK